MICNIYWHNKITNEELYKNTEGMNHRLRWLGHVPRMPNDRIPNIALKMHPNWEEEKRLAKNHLAENNDERAGGVVSNMGKSAGHSSGQSRVAKFNFGLMSHPEEEG